jgi:hypothetical protein
MKSTKVFIDTSLEVQLWSKWKFVVDMCCQPINSSILKNICKAKHEKHMNKEIMNISLIQH